MRTTPSWHITAIGSALGLAVVVACGGDVVDSGAGADGELIVERSRRDGVEVVRNVRGSRWGAVGSLALELEIGEETGAAPYLFGAIDAAWAAGDRIYLIDSQVPVVRAFGRDGQHLFDVGRPGQGPGEYGMPTSLAVTDDGRVVVADALGSRINVYGADGDLIEDWPLTSPKTALDLTLGHDGQLFTRSWSQPAGRLGVQAVGPQGLVGEIRFPPPTSFEPPTVGAGKGLEMIVPFAPTSAWTFAPGGEIVVGTGDAYRFRIEGAAGSVTIVERTWEPVPVAAAEAAFRARIATDSLRMMAEGLRIDAGDVAATKPAFQGFFADRSHRVWLIRQGPGRPDPICADAATEAVPRLIMSTPAGTGFEVAGKSPGFDRDDLDSVAEGCWTDTYLFDLFDLRSGELIGTLEAPERGFTRPLFADDETVLAAVADEAGTVRLKSYRLQGVGTTRP